MAKTSDYDGRVPEPPYDVGDDMTSELAVQLAEMQKAIQQLREQDKLLREDWAVRVQQGFLDRSEIQRLQAKVESLCPIVLLAAQLIQPGDDGPELTGAREFRVKLMMAARNVRDNQ